MPGIRRRATSLWVDAWGNGYNCDRPHHALDMATRRRRSVRGTFPPCERAVVHGRPRRRHRQVWRRAAGHLHRRRTGRGRVDRRVLPHRRAFQPHLVRAARICWAVRRQTTGSGTVHWSVCRSSWGSKGLSSCVGTGTDPARAAGHGFEEVHRADRPGANGREPVDGAFVRLLDGTGEFAAEVVFPASDPF